MELLQNINWHHGVLKNGLEVRIRPIQSTDAPYFIDVFEHLSSDSRYKRFNRPMDHVTQSEKIREALTTAHDSTQHGHGLLAFANMPNQPNAPIGGARYYLTSPTSGELAITLRDDVQGLGLGRQLMQLLIEQARRAGLQKITGLSQHQNAGLWRLLQQTNLPLKRIADGPDSYFELTL